jgi:hypothetical protein
MYNFLFTPSGAFEIPLPKYPLGRRSPFRTLNLEWNPHQFGRPFKV